MKTQFLSILLITLLFPDKWNFQADGELLEYQKDNITINKLTENVEVFNDSIYLKTDEAYRYNELSKLHLYGNTQMISNTDTLICDSMIYWMDKDSLFAYGDVILKQLNRELDAQTLNFWKTNGYRGSSFIAGNQVTINNIDKKMQANNISYNDIKQNMILTDNAIIISGNRELFGDNMSLQFNDSLISLINVTGNAKVHNIVYANTDKNNDSKKKFIDIMLGNNIDITFEKNKIKNVLLDRMASTMYHVIDSTLLIGRNSVNGELINLDFKKDNLHTINVKGDARGNFNIN